MVRIAPALRALGRLYELLPLKHNTLTREVFKSCFDQFFDPIRNYIYYRCGDGELATDVAQEVFTKLWEKQLEGTPQELKSLLYKMAGDMFVNHYRKQQVAKRYQESFKLEVTANTPEEQVEYEELKAMYETALADLPEKQRTVFLMSRMEEMTYREIAERLELGVKAVEKRMSQALQSLKQAMNEA